MEERPGRIVDYIVVVGLGENVTPFKVEAFGEGTGEESLHLTTTPQNISPITDIAVIAKKYESCPKGYTCIEVTSSGSSASLVTPGFFGTPLLLCYRTGGDRPPITEISIYNAEHSKHYPSGHETIAVTVGGRSADLSGGGRYPIYLTIKRGFVHGYSTSTAISGLSVCAGRDDPLNGYKVLHTSGKGTPSSGNIRVCYKSSLLDTQSKAYTAEILSRYPMADYSEFPLPQSVPLFCLPFGVLVEAWERHAMFPLPIFSTFALTSAVGQCMYGACVVFYEKIPNTFPALSSMKRDLSVGEDGVLHVSKCVCLLSHWPFFSAFKAFLSALYRLSISKNIQLPLERYVANLMFHVPFPTTERPRVLMQIGPETIVFSLPVQTPLPMSVSTHWTLLSCLDVDNCILLIQLVLLEQKIVLHSARPSLLTSVGEALRSVLFPLQWKCTYIPMCPLAFCSYLQAPVPFIIGMDSRYFDCYSAPPGVCVIDLDINTVMIPPDIKQLIFSGPLPLKPVKILKKTLNSLSSTVANYQFDGDYAVEVAPLDFGDLHKINQEQADVTIRDAFLKFMAMILANYRLYLRPLMGQPSLYCQDITELFDVNAFIKNKPLIERRFYHLFSDTQIFTSFIEQRSFAHAESTALAFFDECTEKVSNDINSKLLNIERIVSRRDLPTVVTPPPDESGLPQGEKFNYQFFPALDPTLFISPVSLSNSPYTKHIGPIKPNTQSVTSFVAIRTQAEKTKNKNLIQRASGSDVLWAKVLLSHACSIWYMILSYHLRSQWNKVEVLSQAMEILDALRVRQALPNDEVCYRSLMEQCVQMGRPALAVKVYSEMRKAGIHPSAVTYGFYNKAIMEGKWPSTKRRWNVLRIVIFACFYLRQLQQKVSKIEREEDELHDIPAPNFSLLSSSLSSSNSSINALVDVVGVDSTHSDSYIMERRDSSGRLTRESVYRLTSGRSTQGQSDYAVQGDSFYIADKSPLLQNRRDSEASSGGWFLGRTASDTRRPKDKSFRRSVSGGGDGPNVELCVSSCSQCPSCQSLLYDEEIMVCWSEGSAEEYNVTCPYCNKSLVPSLTVVIRKILPSSSNRDSRTDSMRSSTPDRIIEETPPPSPPPTPATNTNTSAECYDSREELDKTPKTEPIHRKTLSVGGASELSSDDPPLPLLITVNNYSVKEEIISPRLSNNKEKTDSFHLSNNKEETVSPRPSDNTEEVDSPRPSLSHYVSLLRARGHKRTSSAPVSLAPATGITSGIISRSNVKTEEQSNQEEEAPPVRQRRASVRVENSEPFTVPYLSPVVLRKELESLFTQGKGSVFISEKVAAEKPILYWNCVWYFTRLKLPTYLPLLTLRSIIKDLPELKQVGVQMHVKTIWDRRIPGISDPIYMIWMGKAPGVVQLPMDRRRRMRRDSNVQLQPLVARMHCGDLNFIMRSLLNDRLEAKNTEGGDRTQDGQRSVYRQMLFLKCVIFPENIDIDNFDRDYQLCLQRLPKELAVLLQSWDYPPTQKAINCRKEFGALQVL